MKNIKSFFINHARVLALCAVVLLIVLTLTTAALTSENNRYLNSADDIDTVSVPTGEVTAKGIDVSRYQGEIDFEKVRSDGFDFVILRVGTTKGGKDGSFETYYKNARKAGLDVGCYFYTYSTTARQARTEAKQVLEYIRGKSFTYPVFFDFEYPELLSRGRTEENTKMIEAFCKVVKRGGYYPGVYTSYSIYRNHIDTARIGSAIDVWIANYRDHTPGYTGYSTGFSMWQYSNTGSVSGIDADVDLNVCYVDYPSVVDKFNKAYNSLDD